MPSGNDPYSRGGVIWSSAGPTPFEDPLHQMLGLGLGLGAAVGAVTALHKTAVGNEGRTAYDFAQRTIRNIAVSTPFGIANTFRLPEFMSPALSAAGQGLEVSESVVDASRNVHALHIGADYTADSATKRMLQAVVGEQAFADSGLGIVGDGNYELRFERDPDARGRGSLFYRKVDHGAKKKLSSGSAPWQKLSSSVSLFETSGPADVLDIASAQGDFSSLRTNQAYLSVLQNLGLTEDMGQGVDKILSKIDPVTGDITDRAAFGFAPSATGPLEGLDDLQRRLAYPMAPLSFAMNRWNRVVDATLDQVPVGRGFLKGLFGGEGALSLKVKTTHASKMFVNIGLKAAKVGLAYKGVEQLDHYRRQWGLAGDVIVSGGISTALHAVLKKNKSGLSPKTVKSLAVASFFSQMLLPGFDQGVIPGLATSAKLAHQGWAAIGAATLTSTYRRTLEGFLPGISDWKTGALLGLGLVGVAHTRLPERFMGRPGSFLPKKVIDRIGFVGPQPTAMPKNLGQNYMDETVRMALDQDRMIFPKTGPHSSPLAPAPWKFGSEAELEKFLGKPRDKLGSIDRHRLMTEIYRRARNGDGSGLDNIGWAQDEIYARKLRAQHHTKKIQDRENPITKSLQERIGKIYQRYGNDPNTLQKAGRSLEVAASQFYHSFFGATMKGEDFKDAMANASRSPRLGRVGTLFFGAMGIHALLTKGIFGTMEGPSELGDIYSGKQLVEVKEGRYWEAGGTPFSGSETSYMRPHQYHLMMTRAKEKAVWGPNEDELSPLQKFFYKNFTYELERKTYHTRPYPMTGSAFSDVPVIGDILAATIGKIIKPPRLMHTNEWLRMGESGDLELAYRPEFHGPSMALGGLPMGVPRSPFDPLFVAANEQYRFREIEGMTGWAKNMLQKGMTGTETFGTTTPVFGQAGSITDPIESFWEMSIGGGFFMSEPIRRLLPRPQSEIQEYNPLLNTMPTWMPNRFKYGDPYRKIEMGWARLPGPGYESIHPELQGLDDEEYPDVYKYAILADVAPQSRATIDKRTELYQRRLQGITSEAENQLMDTIDRNLEKTMVDRKFDHVHPNAIELPGSGATQELYAAAQNVARDAAAPIEYLMPMGFRPMQKLMSDRGAVEQYEFERLYGTPNAFWNKPGRDWFRPSLYSAAHMLGWEGKPSWRQEADKTQGYFDRLEFAKWMRLANNPEAKESDKAYYLRQAQSTRYGVNPMGDAMSIYMSLPESEKKFFDAFTFASGSDRERILDMIPEDQTHLYQALWSRIDQGENIAPYSETGMMMPQDQSRLQGTYAEFEGLGGPMPSTDWIGWHEDVEMEDVKLKFVDNLGKDLYDYGLYEKQLRVMNRKPYLEDSASFLYQPPLPGRSAITQELRQLSRGSSPFEGGDLHVHTSANNGGRTYSHFAYDDNREPTIMGMIANWMD